MPRAVGRDPPLAHVYVIQFVISALVYFVPTPGGSGGAEAGAAAWMRLLIPEALLGAHTVLWRAATAYLSVAVGGLLFIRCVRRHAAEAELGAVPEPTL